MWVLMYLSICVERQISVWRFALHGSCRRETVGGFRDPTQCNYYCPWSQCPICCRCYISSSYFTFPFYILFLFANAELKCTYFPQESAVSINYGAAIIPSVKRRKLSGKVVDPLSSPAPATSAAPASSDN